MIALPFGQYGFSIAVYVIGIMIAVSGISLGLGYAINEKKFKDFGKNELYQSIFNGAIVGAMILLFSQSGLVNQVINQLTLSNSTSMQCPDSLATNAAICLAYNYLMGSGYSFGGVYHSSILTTSTELLAGLFALNAALGVIAAVKLSLLVVTISFAPIVNPIIAEMQYIIRVLSTIAIGAVVQGSVLLFVEASAVSVILPTGIILRTLYPTRKLGGFLMALAIGLYVVFPLSYVFDAAIATSYTTNISLDNVTELNSTATGIGNSLFGSASVTTSNSVAGSVSSSIAGSVKALISSFAGFIDWILQGLAYLIVYTFVLPAFSLIITGIAIREFAEVLGSEASFGRFKLL